MEKPLFEFRAFAQNFGLVEEKIRKLFKLNEISEGEEYYIISEFTNQDNVKIRDRRLEIKKLITEEKRFEQWEPGLNSQFPVVTKNIALELNESLGFEIDFKAEKYDIEKLLEIFNFNLQTRTAKVFKRRFKFETHDCFAELADVYINGALVKSVSLESSNVDTAVDHLKKLRLNDYENVNYILEIKRVLGMEPLP